MTLYYDQAKNRIVCRWGEPTEYIMDKRPVVINRSKSISAKVTKRGRVSKTDRDRYKDHPMLRNIMLFSRELQARGFFPASGPEAPCRVCGAKIDVAPHFDLADREVVWLCQAHQHALS